MKRLAYLITLTLILVSCGRRNGYFKIDGHLLNLNQGEFYAYSPDGVFDGVDTIKVEGGRFAFETPCRQEGAIIIIFPNSSEQPVFAESGASVSMKGDASHLKEIEVDGTDENKRMNGLRKELAKASPPEVTGIVERFIKDNPESLVGVYLLRKYFVSASNADYNKATTLAETIQKAQPKNSEVARMLRFFRKMKHGVLGSEMPSFTAQAINFRTMNSGLLKGKVTVVYARAEWNYDSQSLTNTLNRLKSEFGGKLNVVGISLDPSKVELKKALANDSTSSIIICDQLMFESPLLEQFALSRVSDNILYNAQGRIIERNLAASALESKLRTLLR